jgi:hypothetical protein
MAFNLHDGRIIPYPQSKIIDEDKTEMFIKDYFQNKLEPINDAIHYAGEFI